MPRSSPQGGAISHLVGMPVHILELDIVKNLSKPLALCLATVVGFRPGKVVGPLSRTFYRPENAKGFAFVFFFAAFEFF